MTGQTEEIFLAMSIYNQSHLKGTMSSEGEGRQGGVGGGGERVWLRKMETTWVAGPAAILEPPIALTFDKCWMDRTDLRHVRPLPPIIIFQEAVVAALAWRSVRTSPWYQLQSLSCEAQFHLSYFKDSLYPISKCVLSQQDFPPFIRLGVGR